MITLENFIRTPLSQVIVISPPFGVTGRPVAVSMYAIKAGSRSISCILIDHNGFEGSPVTAVKVTLSASAISRSCSFFVRLSDVATLAPLGISGKKFMRRKTHRIIGCVNENNLNVIARPRKSIRQGTLSRLVIRPFAILLYYLSNCVVRELNPFDLAITSATNATTGTS